MQNIQIQNLQTQHNNHLLKSSYSPNYRGQRSSEMQDDVLNLSVTKPERNHHLGISLLIGGLAIAATVLTVMKLRKPTQTVSGENLSAEFQEIQKLYKEIFDREINASETKDFVKRYKQIIDSKNQYNDKDFCDRILTELCKDRKTKKPKILRWEDNSENVDPIFKRGGMSTSPDGTYIDIYAFNYKNKNNPAKSYFSSLFHETRHVKQYEIIYRTDKEAFVQTLTDKFIDNGNGIMYQDMLRANGGNKSKTIQEVKQALREQLDCFWGGLTPFEKNSAEYKEGLRLIDGIKNYKFYGDCHSNTEYRNQIIEYDAYEDGAKAEKLFDMLTKISL